MQSRPIRDRQTLISYAQTGAWAWFIYSFGPTSALLRDEQGTAKAIAALHGTMLAIGGLIGGLIATALVRRWGRGAVIRATAFASAVGMALYAWPGADTWLTLLGMFVTGLMAGGLLIVLVNAFIVEHQGPAGPASLTEANAIAAGAGLLSPLVVGIGAATVVTWRFGPWIPVIALFAIEFWRGRHTTAYDGRLPQTARGERPTLPASTWWALGALVCFMAAEFSLTLWSADLLRDRHALPAAVAAGALAAITGGMFVGRLFGARLARRRSTETIIRSSLVVALVGFAMTWASPVAWIAILGLFVTGLGIAALFPMGLARAMRASNGQNDRISALNAVWGSLGIAIFPFILGALADAIGIHLAFLVVPALFATAFLLVVLRPIAERVSGAPPEAAPATADFPAHLQ